MRLLPDGDTLGEYAPTLTRIAAAVGLIALAVAFLVVIFGSRATYEVHAVFEDVRGLIPGGEVTAGSDTVGSIEDIRLNEDGLPVVTMSVDDDFRLNQGAFANLRLASNIGGTNRFVDLTQGDGPPLSEGATLGPSQTDQPVDLDTAVSDLDPATRNEVGAILAGVDQAVAGRGDDLARALRHSTLALGETANLLRQVSADRLALRTLVGEGRKVVEALAASPDDLGATAERLASVLRVAAGRQVELARTARALGPGLRSARSAFERLAASIPNLRRLVESARPAVEEFLPTAREIGPLIEALRPLLGEAGALLDAAPAQLRKLRPVLRVAVPVVKRLEPLLDGFGPFLDYMRAWAPEVVGFFTLWADASANYDANGNLSRLGFTEINAPAHTNVIPGSENGPGLIERPFARLPGSLEGEPWLDYADSFIGGAQSIDEEIEPGEEAP